MGVFLGASLISSFIAGVVALFAPCCISYLLPAYLGSVFKERKQVFLMTLVFSAGIFLVMFPIVLGFKFLSNVFVQFHSQTFILGGLVMVLIGVITLFGIKLPMPHLKQPQTDPNKPDVVSIFTLGVFSGITSSCCAPVLLGVLTLSFLSPNLWLGALVAFIYVLGIVTPLYILAYFVDAKKFLNAQVFKKRVAEITFLGKTHTVIMSNLLSFLVFFPMGLLTIYLTVTGKLEMVEQAQRFGNWVGQLTVWIDERVGGNTVVQFGVIVIVVVGLYRMFLNWRRRGSSYFSYYTCPMHPEIRQDRPGKCPKCGGMELVGVNSSGNHHAAHGHDHSEHDHASMMASPEAAADFLKRFFIVTVLLVPLALFSEPGVQFFGTPDFVFRPFVEFGIATMIFYFGLVFFKHARHEIQTSQYGMMTLVSLGVGAGYFFSAMSTFLPAVQIEFYLEISTLVWVLLFGHFLEAKSSSAAGDALQEVAKLLPKQAHLKDGSTVRDVEILDLIEGNVVLVKPGEKVPADGEIIKGGGNFNESHITGESKPVEKAVGAEVVAGAISIDGSVEVRLTRVGESSTIGQIQSLIASAKQTKPAVQRLADRAARWLTVTALVVSVMALIIWLMVGQPLVFAATLAITVLVIACPHALGLAIPTVSTIATKLAVKNGVFIKDMAKIEIVKDADYVVFDKTGTLTQGEFGVTDIEVLNGDEKQLLSVVGAIEAQSSHVIGMAIVAYLKRRGLEFDQASEIKNLAGRGMGGQVEGVQFWVGNQHLMEEKNLMSPAAMQAVGQFNDAGKTPVFVANSEQILGMIGLSDQIKAESKQAVDELHRLGVKVAMLTGDTKAAAAPIAKQLGIDDVFAEVLPEDKYKHIKSLQDRGNVVLMAGDGVNDAPALTQANAGVAIGAGTDVAVEAGDIVLTQSNPQHIVRLIILARKVYRKMVENLFWAVGYNILAIPAAAGLFIPFGFQLTPAVGALLMSLSSVIVVVNAMALRKASLKV